MKRHILAAESIKGTTIFEDIIRLGSSIYTGESEIIAHIINNQRQDHDFHLYYFCVGLNFSKKYYVETYKPQIEADVQRLIKDDFNDQLSKIFLINAIMEERVNPPDNHQWEELAKAENRFILSILLPK